MLLIICLLYNYIILCDAVWIQDCRNETEINAVIAQCFQNVTFDLPPMNSDDFNGDFSSLIQLLNVNTCSEHIIEVQLSSICVLQSLLPCAPEEHRTVFVNSDNIRNGIQYSCSHIEALHDGCITSKHGEISKCFIDNRQALVPTSISPSIEHIVDYLCKSQMLKHDCAMKSLKVCSNGSHFICGLDYLLSESCVDGRLDTCHASYSTTQTTQTEPNNLNILEMDDSTEDTISTLSPSSSSLSSTLTIHGEVSDNYVHVNAACRHYTMATYIYILTYTQLLHGIILY